MIATAAWELGLGLGIPWLNRWGARVLGTLTGGFITAIGFLSAVDSREIGRWAIVVYIAWMVAMYVYYRIRVFDVFMLAGAALSAIIVFTVFLGKQPLDIRADAGGLLVMGLVVIAMSGAAAWWIRKMLREQQT